MERVMTGDSGTMGEPRASSTLWFDTTADDLSCDCIEARRAQLAAAERDVDPRLVLDEVVDERWKTAPEQMEEVAYVIQVYSDNRVQLKVDRFRRLLLRCTVSLDLAEGAVRVVVTLVIPPVYPQVGHPLGVRVSSRLGNRDFLMELTQALTAEAHSCSELGISAINQLLNTAKETMSHMPPAQLADHFGCCVECNARSLRKGTPKEPQPAIRGDYSGQYRCMICGSNSIPLPMIQSLSASGSGGSGSVGGGGPADGGCCSFCFTDDVPYLVHLRCGCKACFECFVHFSDLAIGSKFFAKMPFRHGAPLQKFDPQPTPTQLLQELVGIPCPAHKNLATGIIYEPGLLKLLPPRTYNRFNFFAMEYTLKEQPGVVTCPLPQCCGYPFLTDQPGQLVECPFCGDVFCARCNESTENDKCQCKPYADVVRVPPLQIVERFGSQALLKRRSMVEGAWQRNEQAPPLLTGGASTTVTSSSSSSSSLAATGSNNSDAMITILVMLRNKQLPLQLPLKGEWYPRLAGFVQYSELCPYAQIFRQRQDYLFHAVFHGALLDAERSLSEQWLFNGAIVFVIETFHADDWTLRRLAEVALHLFATNRNSAARVVEKKRCPVCDKPVLHYLGHGCHMIFGCHPGMPEWCYVCGNVTEKHLCSKGCNLFCKYKVEKDHKGRPIITNDGCDCLLCPDCKPMRPCDLCTFCPMCTMDGVTTLI